MTVSTIGRMVYMNVADGNDVPAKIDSGAFGSAVHASEIVVDEEGVLHFVLFSPDSRYYTGKKHSTRDYGITMIRSSNGHEQVRYVVRLNVNIKGKTIKARFSLSNRVRNWFPVLIGCNILKGHFLVDVSDNEEYKQYVRVKKRYDAQKDLTGLSAEFRNNPHLFYKQKYLNQE